MASQTMKRGQFIYIAQFLENQNDIGYLGTVLTDKMVRRMENHIYKKTFKNFILPVSNYTKKELFDKFSKKYLNVIKLTTSCWFKSTQGVVCTTFISYAHIPYIGYC
jgi:hypothetical protein